MMAGSLWGSNEFALPSPKRGGVPAGRKERTAQVVKRGTDDLRDDSSMRMRRTSGGLWVPDGRGGGEQPKAPPEGPAEPPTAETESVEDLRARLEAAEQEAREHRESWRRVLADFENVRRRSAIELSEARDRGRTEVLMPLLGVLDDVDRALAAALATDESAAIPPAEDPIWSGLRLIRAGLWNLLVRQGVEEIPATGEAFDPHVHEAVMQLDSDTVPPGHVAQILARGYRLGERVLRPARVAVAKSPSAT
jgi:molecular chaperone GrpE